VSARSASNRRPADPPLGDLQPTSASDQVYAKAQRQVDELLPLRRTRQWRLVQHLSDRRSAEALLEEHQAACRVVPLVDKGARLKLIASTNCYVSRAYGTTMLPGAGVLRLTEVEPVRRGALPAVQR
jgi:hypothetical protein